MLLWLWAAPGTAIGLLFGSLGLATGGRVQIRRNCLEFYGGFVTWMLSRLPPQGVHAMTLGHAIVGQSATGLDICRDHEQVHVRQYERWGPFFIPAYLTCSFVLWLRCRDWYRENPFEIEAYRIADPIIPPYAED